MLQQLISAFKGTAQARAAHRRALASYDGIFSGMQELHAQCPPPAAEDDEQPIFLLSAGWRSGSTLLQRLLMSDPNVLIWGEPYDECGIIQALADSMKAFRPGWPPADYYYDGTEPVQLSGEWIANLFPSLEELRNAQRAFFNALFVEPARKAGTRRWGIKEVRLGAEHCYYLRWLYPKAKFLFLYRSPFDAYRSYCSHGRNWYNTFPDKPVFTAHEFGRHWRDLAEGFLQHQDELGAVMVRYEDLVAGKAPLVQLEAELGLRIDASVLNAKLGSAERFGKNMGISRADAWLLRRAVAPIATQLGYK
jgi:hypothetical protein